MPTAGIYVDGLRDKVKALEQLGVDVAEVKDVMAGVAAEATEVVQANLPTRSGKLRGSARGNKAKGSATVTIGRASVPYAGPIVWGWPKRHIRSSGAVERTDAVMQDRAVELLAAGFAQIAERNGLA